MRTLSIFVDRYVAAPFTPVTDTDKGQPFPEDPTKYYIVTIPVYNRDGSAIASPVPVYIGDDQNERRVQYWDANKNDITAEILEGKPVYTDDRGRLILYAAISNFQYPPYPGCIWNLFASLTPNPRIDAVNQTLTCCYFKYEDAVKSRMRNWTLSTLRCKTKVARDKGSTTPYPGNWIDSIQVQLKIH